MPDTAPPAATSPPGRMTGPARRLRSARRRCRYTACAAAPRASSPRAPRPHSFSGQRAIFRRHDVARHAESQHVDASPVEAHDLELAIRELQRLAAPWQATELLHHQARDGIELVVGQLGLEVLVELVDRRLAADEVLALTILADVHVLVDVVL